MTAVIGIDPATAPARRRRMWRSPLIVLSAAFLGLAVICAITGTLLAPYDPSAQDLTATLEGPSASHWLGTDDSGRDLLSRIIAGARAAVVGPAAIVLGSVVIGTVLGLAAGYRGGWVDTAVMRGVDLLYALPGLLVAIVLLGVLGGGYLVAVGVLVVLTAPSDTRVIRGGALEQRNLPYVDAARTLGLSPRTVMYRHIWPNLLPLIVANAFLNFAYALVSLSALSFLGLGVGPGEADWGRMLADNLQLVQDHPLPALAAGAALVLTATSANLLGDWCYERLSDRGRAR